VIVLLFPLQVLGADQSCQSFLLQGEKLVIGTPAGSLQSGSLAAIVTGLDESEQLLVDFPSSELCVSQGTSDMTETDGARFVVNPNTEELAIEATLSGSTEIWLRLNPGYESELLLSRSVGEETGLTDMEFLSDNSGVGAEDFFAEQIDYLELGSYLVDAPFAEVPRYGVEYSHYDQAVNQGAEGFIPTQGILGLSLIRSLTLRFSPAQGLVFLVK